MTTATRWSYYTRGLVHRVLALHHSVFVEVAGQRCPRNAVTECGILVTSVDAAGWYVPDAPSTCVLCATGACELGSNAKVVNREALFGMTYGKTSERVLADYPKADAEAAIRMWRDLQASDEEP